MQNILFRHYVNLGLLWIAVGFLLGSCATARVHQQNILFRTDGSGRMDTAKLRNVVNRAERNYIIQPNDALDVRVYTNNGERILDPNGELMFGSPGGIGGASGGAGGGTSRQATSGRSSGQGRQQSQQGQQSYTEFLVQHDGTVKLPMVNYQKLAGLTLLEADSLLQRKYTEFYKDVFVTTRVSNNRIIVLGAAAGGSGQVIQMFNDNMSLLEVLAQAGGIEGAFVGTSASAGAGRADNIRLIRGDLKNPQVQIIDLTTIEGMRRANLQVEPNDIVYVEPIRRPFYEGLQDAAPLFSLIGSIAAVISTIYFVSNINN